jgi:hypothetical protein
MDTLTLLYPDQLLFKMAIVCEPVGRGRQFPARYLSSFIVHAPPSLARVAINPFSKAHQRDNHTRCCMFSCFEIPSKWPKQQQRD